MESLGGISRLIQEAASQPAAEKFSQAGIELVEARNEIKEGLQELTAGAMQAIIDKLRKNESLGQEEKDLIRIWIVGDAEAYTKMENDFQAWLDEFKRLGQGIGEFNTVPTGHQEMLNLYGQLEDAVRLAADLQFFMEEKERIGRFEQAIQTLSASDAELLAGILQEKLNSPEI